MDCAQVLKWLGPILLRAVAWILAAKFGMDAAQAETVGGQIVGAVLALTLAAVAVWTSVRGRQKLLATPPPRLPPPASDRALPRR